MFYFLNFIVIPSSQFVMMSIRKAAVSLMIIGHPCLLDKKLWEFMVKCISVS